MKLRSFATVALILLPSLAFAAGGGNNGGASNGNGASSTAGANSSAGNGNNAGDNNGNGTGNAMGGSGPGTDATGTMGNANQMKRQTGEPQKTP
jgi:hypothetical protein